MSQFQQSLAHFEQALKIYFANRRAENGDVAKLFDSMEYSLLNGGKRFRPLLCYAVGEALGLSRESVTPVAMAVECVHTYSLIHDDLPCMDDDDERRGQPTNHRRFSENLALLAGDALLTEAFRILAESDSPLCSQWTAELARAAGAAGMVRGQVLDLGHGKEITELGDLIHLHELKTGQLIAFCFTAPAMLAQRPHRDFYELGLMLGLAFQIKDDLLDIDEQDAISFTSLLGEEGTRSYLESLTEKIQKSLRALSIDTGFMQELTAFNQNRHH